MPLKLPKDRKGHVSHTRSPKQEKELAARIGGRVTRGSGSGKYDLGDAVLPRVIRIEAKTTVKKSFAVTREMIEKIESAAMSHGEIPCMEIEFLSKDGKREIAVALFPVHVIQTIAKHYGTS